MKKLRDYTGKPLQDCTILELYNAALTLTQDACKDRGYNSGKKKVYYISAETAERRKCTIFRLSS